MNAVHSCKEFGSEIRNAAEAAELRGGFSLLRKAAAQGWRLGAEAWKSRGKHKVFIPFLMQNFVRGIRAGPWSRFRPATSLLEPSICSIRFRLGIITMVQGKFCAFFRARF